MCAEKSGKAGAAACEKRLPVLHPHTPISQQGGWEFLGADDKGR